MLSATATQEVRPPFRPRHIQLGPSSPGEKEFFYQTVLESLSEGVIISDAEDRIVFANGVASWITGYEVDELLGVDAREILFAYGSHPAEPGEACPGRAEVELKRKDGEMGWVYLHTTPYSNKTGETVGTISSISCIHHLKCLEFEKEALQTVIRDKMGSFVGDSPALQKVMAQIATVAPTEAGVLILGESGVGKELVAHAIHELSPRKDHPLIRVNCASIPKGLFESEFFGHVRGAFTSAMKDRVGRFELAHRGTLFLDEVGEIPLELQGKLLRVLQEGQFERLGDERTRTVDVRVVAATNRDLMAEAKAGRFRIDLYYRLSVFPIEVPPLRERKEDLPKLTAHFARDAARRLGVRPPAIRKADLRELEAYDWPGNVRELQNVIERAVILGGHRRLDLDLPKGPTSAAAIDRPSDSPIEETELSLDELVIREREIVLTALRRANGKIYGKEGAAAILKVKPTTLSSMMKRLRIDRQAAANS